MEDEKIRIYKVKLMEVKDFQFGDEKDILSLFEITFGRFMRQDVWQWRFQNNPAGKHYIKLM